MRLSIWCAWFVACSGEPPSKPPEDPPPGDADGDGFSSDEDCDDDDPAVHPGADEHCDGLDEDCDQVADDDPVDGQPSWPTDSDGDGFGDPGAEVLVCFPIPGERPDCDDADAERYPGAPERCNDLDDDCDPATVDGVQIGSQSYPSLEQAILAAEDGDTLVACAGTHLAAALRIERPLTIAGASDDPADTVLDAAQGGPVFVVDGGELTLSGLTLTNGTGRPSMGGDTTGGAIDAVSGLGGPLTVRHCLFEDNTATVGGAIAAAALTVEDSTFRANSAFQGGAIAHRGVAPDLAGPLVLARVVLTGNDAGSGGALETRSQSVTLTDCTLQDNTADFGGAIDMSGGEGPLRNGELVLEGTVLTANSANVGGGIYTYATNVTLDAASELVDNTSLLDGAGANFDGETWTGGTVRGNVSMRSGGGIAAYTGSFSGVTFEGNSAAEHGGGFYASEDVSFEDCAFTSNSAAQDGGAIHATFSALEIVRTEIRGNDADRGGGIAHNRWDAYDGYDLRLVESVVTENTAARWGGGLYAELRGGSLQAIDTDFGEPASDNAPDDVAIAADFDGSPVTYAAFEAGATFTCHSYPTLQCVE